ncbi:CHAD domain-containing protein [Trinickia terrae]|nr:CHAD domain-containing protein [Trinickia terrae]
MSRVVEISLDMPAMAACEWLQQAVEVAADQAGKDQAGKADKKPTARRAKQNPAAGGAGEALANALDRSGKFSSVSARTRLTIHPLALSRKLTEAGWRTMAEVSPGGRRMLVSRRETHAPAVTVREFFVDAPLEASAAIMQHLTVPSELREALDEEGAQVSLPAAVLEFHRTTWRWTSEDGHAVDVVLNDAFDATPEAMPHFCELLLSSSCPNADETLSDGEQPDPLARAVHALFAVAEALVAELPVFPVLSDALERTLRAPAAEEPVRAIPVDLLDLHTPHAALIAIGANIAQQWFGNERGVHETATIEFVHQMRVAQRRLRTAMRIFSGWTDADWTTRVAPGLKWLGDLLGEARDLDVFTDSTLPALAAADTDASAWSAVLASADARRLAARGRLQAAMRSRRYAQLSLAWLAWLASLPMRGAPEALADTILHAFVAKRVRKHFRRLADTAKLPELDAAARHRHRIEAKRLRYILEFFESIASGRTRRDVAKTLQRIQSVLGDGNDAVVALRLLEQLDITPYQRGFARGWSQAVGHWTAQEGERLLRTLEEPRIKGGA